MMIRRHQPRCEACNGYISNHTCMMCGRPSSCPCFLCASNRKADGAISGARDWRGVPFAGVAV